MFLALFGVAIATQGALAEPGQLTVIRSDGRAGVLCPLEGTRVTMDIAGIGARVVLVQTFHNPSDEPIEAVYTFPMPHEAAIDRMRIRVGGRIIEGEIMERGEARVVYEAARQAGQVAALLDQERRNIFSQAVANIMPGAKVEVEISYVQMLKFEDGWFEIDYPMVVGPRFIPPGVEDAANITPPVMAPGSRAGSTIDLKVTLDAGAPVIEWKSVLHDVDSKVIDESRMSFTLRKRDEIPNRDFILRYRISSTEIAHTFMTHTDAEHGGFFAFAMVPPATVVPQDIAPKEVIVVMDQSGSQDGFPIAKSKELVENLINNLGTNDTFNVISFANEPRLLFTSSRPNTEGARTEAIAFVRGLEAKGGTVLLPALMAAFNQPPDEDRLRVILFCTDGYVGNDYEILDAVKKHSQTARMFTFGIGNSVNRYLVDGMATEGRGASEIVTLDSQASEIADHLERRMRYPLLTDVSVSIEGAEAIHTFPKSIADVFTQTPLIVYGRYSKPGTGRIVVSGKLAGHPWAKAYDVVFPARAEQGSALMSLWARHRVGELTREDFEAMYQRGENEETKRRIVEVGTAFGIMTQYTSFVAVEKKVVNVGGKQRTVAVPVDMADGVSFRFVSGIRVTATGSNVEVREIAAARGGFLTFGGGGAAGPPSQVGRSDAYLNGLSEEDLKQVLDKMSAGDRRKFLYEARIPEDLRKATGELALMISLSKTSQEILDALKEAGFKIDDKDDALKLVFGTCDASKLIEIAQIFEVRAVTKLDE